MSSAPEKAARSQSKGNGKRKETPGGERAREKLLDAAELMFADHGYDGTSLRDIAEAAEQNLASSTYYFGTKEKLFEEVVRRRAVEFISARLEALARINPDELTASENVRLLIEAFATPILKAAYGRSKQHQAYHRIMARLINEKRWIPLFQRYYNETDDIFIKRWRQAMPHADEASLLDALSFLVGSILSACSYTNRFGSRPNAVVERIRVIEDLIGYSHAGFMAIEEKGARQATQTKSVEVKPASERVEPSHRPADNFA